MPSRLHGTPDEWFAWLTGPDAQRRKEATLILGGLQPEDPVDPAALIARLEDSSSDRVFWAIIGLSCLGPRAEAAVPKLAQVSAADPAFGHRQAALGALVRVGPRSLLAKQAILYALGDKNFWVRHSALEALISISELTADDLSAINKMEEDPEPLVRDQVEITLRNIRRRGSPAA